MTEAMSSGILFAPRSRIVSVELRRRHSIKEEPPSFPTPFMFRMRLCNPWLFQKQHQIDGLYFFCNSTNFSLVEAKSCTIQKSSKRIKEMHKYKCFSYGIKIYFFNNTRSPTARACAPGRLIWFQDRSKISNVLFDSVHK